MGEKKHVVHISFEFIYYVTSFNFVETYIHASEKTCKLWDSTAKFKKVLFYTYKCSQTPFYLVCYPRFLDLSTSDPWTNALFLGKQKQITITVNQKVIRAVLKPLCSSSCYSRTYCKWSETPFYLVWILDLSTPDPWTNTLFWATRNRALFQWTQFKNSAAVQKNIA